MDSKKIERKLGDVFVESMVRKALVRLNPEIAKRPERADEVLHRLRAFVIKVESTGLTRANEELCSWLKGERSMPFGPNNEHVTIRLIDFDNPPNKNNELVVTNQWAFSVGEMEKRYDIVFLVNGFPLIIGEAKSPVRESTTWLDGASDIHDNYEKNTPQMFVPNLLSFATEGKAFRYGSIVLPLEKWGPWRDPLHPKEGSLADVKHTVESMLKPEVILDIFASFTIFATDKKHQRNKIICRYQQYEAANKIVDRVVKGQPKKGLIWHFQGSGKSLLMVFAAQKLRLHPKLLSPTVLIIVDRIDLDTQITDTFNAADVPNLISTDSRDELEELLRRDVRKVIITTIYKFGEAEGLLNDRSNIIAMVDEAHRTQEGDLGRKMRKALPNAFLFGMTGTPINKRDRNTFLAFGAEEDENNYLSHYSFEDSLRDKATLPLHFETTHVTIRIDREGIDTGFDKQTSLLTDEERNLLVKRAGRTVNILKSPEVVESVVTHILDHYRTKIEPNGFKAQVVTYDRESCVLYKKVFDKLTGDPEMSAVVMHTSSKDSDEWMAHARDKDEEGKLLDRFRDPNDPLKILIVTSKLLTGFDAPILQVMYLNKDIRDHNLLQAIARTNRPYPNKDHGLVVDYIGVFNKVATSLNFDYKGIHNVITNLNNLKKQLPGAVEKCLGYFPNVNRSLEGWEGLIAAQECIRNNEERDNFAADYSVVSRLWEALSPDIILSAFEEDYKWLTQVYESLKPTGGEGKLLWRTLGAKTIAIINQNVHVDTIPDDLEPLVMDAELIESLSADEKPKIIKELEVKIIARLRKHRAKKEFIDLGERLEQLREQHEQDLISSIDFLKKILELAKELLKLEKTADPVEERKEAKAALTELFTELQTDKTPRIIEKIVNEIDSVVRVVRFPEWQRTTAGERDIKQSLRRTLLKYKLHRDNELFDRTYDYIKQYY